MGFRQGPASRLSILSRVTIMVTTRPKEVPMAKNPRLITAMVLLLLALGCQEPGATITTKAPPNGGADYLLGPMGY